MHSKVAFKSRDPGRDGQPDYTHETSEPRGNQTNCALSCNGQKGAASSDLKVTSGSALPNQLRPVNPTAVENGILIIALPRNQLIKNISFPLSNFMLSGFDRRSNLGT